MSCLYAIIAAAVYNENNSSTTGFEKNINGVFTEIVWDINHFHKCVFVNGCFLDFFL